MENYLPPEHFLVKNRNIKKSLKCGWAKDVLTTPLAHTPHFFATVLTFQFKLQLIHELFFGPSLGQNLLIALAISMQEELQPKNTTCQSHPGCCITSLWGLLGGYSQTVPHHVEKGIGEWKERETFISHYMIAAWQHLNLHTGCIHPMQSESDSRLNKITK